MELYCAFFLSPFDLVARDKKIGSCSCMCSACDLFVDMPICAAVGVVVVGYCMRRGRRWAWMRMGTPREATSSHRQVVGFLHTLACCSPATDRRCHMVMPIDALTLIVLALMRHQGTGYMVFDGGDEEVELIFFDRMGKEIIGKPLITIMRADQSHNAPLEDVIQSARSDMSIRKEFLL